MFVHEGSNRREAVASMPGVERLSLDLLLPVAEECVNLGIPCLALFPAIDASLKTPDGQEAANPDGLIPRVVRALKKNSPSWASMTDVALDPYTSHGQDGLLDETGYILNDETVEVLVGPGADAGRSRCGHGRAQRHDGRAHRRHPRGAGGARPHPHPHHGLQRQVRQRLLRPLPRCRGHARRTWARPTKTSTRWTRPTPTKPCAKWPWTSPKARTWSWSSPACPTWTCVRRVKDDFKVPTFAYQVSGEYAMLKAAAANGWLDHDAVMMEIAAGLQARRGRWHPDLLRHRRGQKAARPVSSCDPFAPGSRRAAFFMRTLF